jgi:hypothetical protein
MPAAGAVRLHSADDPSLGSVATGVTAWWSERRRLVLALSVAIGLSTFVAERSAAATIVEVRVSASTDDAEEGATKSVNLVSTDLS